MLKSNLCNCSDSYILIRGTIFVANTSAGDTDAKNDNLTMFLIIEEAKETILWFPQGTLGVLQSYFALI